MDLDTYQELTGTTVEAEDQASVNAQIRRTRIALETMLGYSLKKKEAGVNQYEEKGKTKSDCTFRGLLSDIDNLELDPPDDVQGSYRIFPYNKSDKYFKVDPFTRLYKVKLVFLRDGDDPNGITHKTFDSGQIRIEKEGRISRYIERCHECWCTCECDSCVQLAVEADWLNEECLPEDLLYVWADMVEYYCDPNRGVISETLGTHSYKLAESAAPETMDENIAIIKKYAGPNGSVHRTIV